MRHWSDGKLNIGTALRRIVVLLILVGGIQMTAAGQWLEPKRLKVGMSAGFGGMHAWGKPSFDLKYHRLTARISPGLYYFSGGLTYQLAFFRPKVRKDRIIILNAYYLNEWLLAGRRTTAYRQDQAIYMLMPGIHVNLNHRGTVYLEVSAGPMYMHERTWARETSAASVRDYFGPMGEIRIGGIFLSRKERVQQFPRKEPKQNKIQKRKLKY